MGAGRGPVRTVRGRPAGRHAGGSCGGGWGNGVRRTFLAAPSLPAGSPCLIVTGFMGTGKTEAGREAARLLGMPFIDLDGAVERRAGMPVAELFEGLGEEAFRRLEREAVADAA